MKRTNKKVTIKEVKTQEERTPKFMSINSIIAEREDGYEFIWEAINFPETVHIIVNKVDSKELVFVKQIRLPIMKNYPNTGGVCIECCAGVVDKSIPTIEIAREEIKEELGYDVTSDRIRHINTVYSGLGFSGSKTYMYYTEVTDADIVEDEELFEEDIIPIFVPYKDIDKFFQSDEIVTDSTTMYLIEKTKEYL